MREYNVSAGIIFLHSKVPASARIHPLTVPNCSCSPTTFAHPMLVLTHCSCSPTARAHPLSMPATARAHPLPMPAHVHHCSCSPIARAQPRPPMHCSCSPLARARPLSMPTDCSCPPLACARLLPFLASVCDHPLLEFAHCPCPPPAHFLPLPSPCLCPLPTHPLQAFTHCPCPPPARARHCLCQSLMLQVATIDYDKYSLAPEEYLCTACPPGYEAGFLEFF
jgi:hypothetical protein